MKRNRSKLFLESIEDGELGLTSKEAYKMLGGRGAVAKFVARVNKDQPWWTVTIDPCIDEENPEDMDFLNVQIEMNYRSCKGLSQKYMEQREDVVTEQVWHFLNNHGLDFDYECSGDGDEGPISSYRVRLAE